MTLQHSRRHCQVGLDRLVRLEWLERTANLVLAGNEASAVRATLEEDLQGAFRSANAGVRGSLDKTVTILTKVWSRPEAELRSFQRDGLALLSRLPRELRVAVHWGMVMAAYPFWGAVAAQVGRLLRLQGEATAGQVQRRLREQYGERETVTRRVRYVLRSFVDWGVLKETSQDGVYTSGISLRIASDELIAWLSEAVLHSHPNGSMELGAILNAPSLFPFELNPVPAARLAGISGRLDVLRHGLDQDLVMLRTGTI